MSGSESACTPDSVRTEVRGDHPSGPPVTRTARAAYPGVEGRAALPLFGLAPGGVCRATRVTPGAGALLPHRFTLTCAHRPGGRSAIGGLLSVALSCGSPRLGVAQHRALWSPDVPRNRSRRSAATRPTRCRPQPTTPDPAVRPRSLGEGWRNVADLQQTATFWRRSGPPFARRPSHRACRARRRSPPGRTPGRGGARGCAR